jgi:pimeloyl-ACP methyl ester carboxylesterase
MGRRMVRGSLGPQARPEDVDLTLEGFATTTGWARAGFLVAMASMDLRPAGLVIGEVPTTVIVGTRDTLTPVRSGRALAEGIRSAELRVLPDAGHMLPLEEPDAIVDAISAMTRAGTTAAD